MTDPSPIAPSGARGFVTFRSGRAVYAVPAGDVTEVLRAPDVAKVPHSPRGLLGLANIRGTVLPLASLRGLLGRADGASDSASDRANWAILLGGAAPVAVAVDAIEGIVHVGVADIVTREAEAGAEKGERLLGAFRHNERVTKILDLPALLAAAFAAPERRARTRLASSGANAASVQSTAPRGTRMLVTFDVAGQEYALDLATVQEIAAAPSHQVMVPGADPVVLGVAPFRETLLPLLSLRGLLGLRAEEGDGSRRKVIITDVAGVTVGLVADDARSVLAADPALIEPTPPLLAARAGGETHITAIYRDASGRRIVSIVATNQLFREDVMQRLASNRNDVAVQPAGTKADEEESILLVFRLGGDEFGLPIAAVEEVARVPDQITRVPKTPTFLEGVVNLRGDVLPVIDQRQRFEMPAREAGAGRRLVVVRTERNRAGLIVDSVSEVLRTPTASIEPAPDIAGQRTRLVQGVVNVGDSGRLVLVLDPTELLTRAERGMLDAFGKVAALPGES